MLAIVPTDGRASARRPRRHRRPRHVLGRGASPVHGAIQRLQPHRPPREGARDGARRPGSRRVDRRRSPGGRAGPPHPPRARRHHRRRGPRHRRRHRRRALGHARDDGAMAAPRTAPDAVAGTPPRPGDRLGREHLGPPPGPARRPVQRRRGAPPRRRPRTHDRTALRRGAAPRRPGPPSTRRPDRDPAHRARRIQPAAASIRVGPAARARPGCGLGGGAVARPGRDRRRAPARRTGYRRPRPGDRPRHRGPRGVDGDIAAIRVPELGPRVVALAYLRRPAPSAPARALFEVLRDVVPARAADQPGVRLGTEAFPLSRSV